ncbi:NAD(P)H-hydrate dehydratase [Methanothrix sp.]|uniref:NAD(P)H-hydrate dehydratase n=1 Tax=Methanothrix sp. TaxID=90426 RepID=UPI003C7382CD
MRYISAEEMGAIDANCAYLGISTLQLMENAGAALAGEIRKLGGNRIAIIAGRGNNGGDAFVAARHLDDLDVTVFLVGRARDITTEEARRNWDVLRRLEFDLREIADVSEIDLSGYDLVVDALFGTGVRGPIKGLEGDVIDLINACGKRIVSVDVPSGMGTGKEVSPDITITFHRPKIGMKGDFRVVGIGIPGMAEFLVGPGDLKLLGRRGPESHKGDSGRILVIGGGPYTGAPALSAMAALRAGADIVTVAAPRSVADTISSFSPNMIVRPLTSDRLCMADLEILKGLIPRHDVVVIGMGLGRDEETLKAVSQILPLCDRVVIDADALQPDMPLKGIVTPHAGEFRRISGLDLPKGRERIEVVRRFARERGLVVLLKGRMDIITDGETVRGNTTGNPGMTVGGTGDVLAGITGAFYARADAMRAAAAAAFVNGRAGDLVYRERDFGMVATDLIDKIPEAMMV